MVKTIGNPASWAAQALGLTGRSIGDAVDRMGSHDLNLPKVNTIGMADIRAALASGWADFTALRSDVLTLVVVYPVIGLVLAGFAFNMQLFPLIFPLASGFVLLGPVAAIGLYEMSRRREAGEGANWGDAFAAIRAGTFGPILALGGYLAAIFLVWLYTANGIYQLTLGPEAPVSVGAFLTDVFTTWPGWIMVVAGMGVGFVFACLVLVTSLVSFPMLIDRRAGLPVAVTTSVAVARKSPSTVAAWGLIVAVLLAVASIPLFLGLIVALPVLGHATWHLYRAAVSFGPA